MKTISNNIDRLQVYLAIFFQKSLPKFGLPRFGRSNRVTETFGISSVFPNRIDGSEPLAQYLVTCGIPTPIFAAACFAV